MGAKQYRGADKPKKIRKRFSQTRSWFRTLKWTACMINISQISFRSRPSHMGCWTPLQGKLGFLNRSTLASWLEEIRSPNCRPLQATLPWQEPLRPSVSTHLSAHIHRLLLSLLRCQELQYFEWQVPETRRKHAKSKPLIKNKTIYSAIQTTPQRTPWQAANTTSMVPRERAQHEYLYQHQTFSP